MGIWHTRGAPLRGGRCALVYEKGLFVLAVCDVKWSCQAGRVGEDKTGYKSYDVALQSLQGTGPEFRSSAPNHAPIVVEALAALGRDDAVHRMLDLARGILNTRPMRQASR